MNLNYIFLFLYDMNNSYISTFFYPIHEKTCQADTRAEDKHEQARFHRKRILPKIPIIILFSCDKMLQLFGSRYSLQGA